MFKVFKNIQISRSRWNDFTSFLFSFEVNLNTHQLFLLRLINHIQNKDAEQWKGVFYICILFVSNIVWTLSCHMSLHNSVIVGIQMRSSVVSVLYRKSLKISNKARAQFTIGEITNYMRYVNTGNSPLLINVLIFHPLNL